MITARVQALLCLFCFLLSYLQLSEQTVPDELQILRCKIRARYRRLLDIEANLCHRGKSKARWRNRVV